jgi:hypothetical protein
MVLSFLGSQGWDYGQRKVIRQQQEAGTQKPQSAEIAARVRQAPERRLECLLALTGLEARVLFVDHVDPATTTHHATAFFAQLSRF